MSSRAGAIAIVLLIILLVCVAILCLRMHAAGHMTDHGGMINPEAVIGEDGEYYIPGKEESVSQDTPPAQDAATSEGSSAAESISEAEDTSASENSSAATEDL